ncbi:response regulator [Rheinheimera sp. MMS21-TC3]|uniref:response regulator n=1 Tax=Rheinheimera sp. MMS21-TC3 TaxID=3072790 RepID=UPI0028C44F52|nr:response regulator [Rheinheimera sp. MMS21-TC3]WNO60563.1 response regulator [Rheinheimera sp. MMS21-TC3]
MIFKDSFYNSKKILLVQDNTSVRVSIKGMLQQIGFSQITAVADANLALQAAEQSKFDFIVADFQIGDNQNGLQLQANLLQQKLLKYSCCFVLINDEPVQLAELALLQGQPDAFILKPFSYIKLEKCLAQAWKQRSSLRKVYQALELQHLEQVHQELDSVIKSAATSALLALRYKGEILLAQQQFAAAKQLYHKILQQRDFTWAKLGLAASLVQLQEVESAEALLNQLIEQEQAKPEALQWLCQLHLTQSKVSAAQSLLADLLRLQPNNVNAHCLVAVSHELVQDYDKACDYWQKLIQQYRFSGFDNPEYYLQLSRLLINKAAQADIASFNQVLKKAEDALASMPQKLQTLNLSCDITLLQIRLLILNGNMDKALRDYQRLQLSLDNVTISKTAYFDYSLLCLAFADTNLADKIIRQLQGSTFAIDPHRANWQDLQAKLLLEQYQKFKSKSHDWHKAGIADVQEGQVKSALVKLRQAFLLIPYNVKNSLSLLQVLTEVPGHKALKQLTEALLASLNTTDLTVAQQQRLSKLISALPVIYLN